MYINASWLSICAQIVVGRSGPKSPRPIFCPSLGLLVGAVLATSPQRSYLIRATISCLCEHNMPEMPWVQYRLTVFIAVYQNLSIPPSVHQLKKEKRGKEKRDPRKPHCNLNTDYSFTVCCL